MDTLNYAPKDPAPRSALLRFVVDHNPFYLLSAMCMLGGCLALTNSLSFDPIRLGKLMALVVTLAVYEALLLGLGLMLVRRKGLARDGTILLLLEALFLVDAAFLNVEVFAIDLHVGLATNATLFVLGVVKLYAVFRVLRVPLGGRFVYAAVQLALLSAIPGVFAAVAPQHYGWVPPPLVYAAWWAVGLLPALYVALVRAPSARPAPAAADPPVDPAVARVSRLLTGTFVVLPLVSLLAHLAMMHWVHKATFHVAYLAPMFLGLAVVLGRLAPMMPAFVVRPATLPILRSALPAAAVLLSVNSPDALHLTLSPGRPDLSPLLLALVGAYVAYVYCYLLRHALWYLGAGAVAALVVALGPTPAQVTTGVHAFWRSTAAVLAKLIPKTTTGWGVLAVAASFAFLGIGAACSLRKGRMTR